MRAIKSNLYVTNKNTKENIIKDFTEIIWQVEANTPDEINNKLADIIKRVRKLYAAGRDIEL